MRFLAVLLALALTADAAANPYGFTYNQAGGYYSRYGVRYYTKPYAGAKGPYYTAPEPGYNAPFAGLDRLKDRATQAAEYKIKLEETIKTIKELGLENAISSLAEPGGYGYGYGQVGAVGAADPLLNPYLSGSTVYANTSPEVAVKNLIVNAVGKYDAQAIAEILARAGADANDGALRLLSEVQSTNQQQLQLSHLALEVEQKRLAALEAYAAQGDLLTKAGNAAALTLQAAGPTDRLSIQSSQATQAAPKPAKAPDVQASAQVQGAASQTAFAGLSVGPKVQASCAKCHTGDGEAVGAFSMEPLSPYKMIRMMQAIQGRIPKDPANPGGEKKPAMPPGVDDQALRDELVGELAEKLAESMAPAK
jgi:hypothetical protein